MAGNNRESAGWGFKLLAILLTLAAIVGVFGFGFSKTGNELSSVLSAAIPVAAGLIGAYVLGSIDKISHKRWHIYVVILLATAAFLLLRAGIF